jgi:hypothetical protein
MTHALRPAHSVYARLAVLVSAAMQHITEAINTGVIAMKLLEKIFGHRLTRREAENAYLAGSASLYDLELREREIERGKFAAY